MDAVRHQILRLATVAAVLAAGAALSGCHELLRVVLRGDSDPPVHNPPPAGRSVPAATAAAAGTAFTGQAVGRLAGRIQIKHGFVKSTIKNARFDGTFTGTPAANREALGPFANADWKGVFKVVRNRRTGKIKLTGLVLATFADPSAGRACLRVGYRAVRKQQRKKVKKSRSTVTVLGGEGGARTLRGSATARVTKISGDSLGFKGSVKTSQGAARGFPAACTKLEKKFGLTPL